MGLYVTPLGRAVSLCASQRLSDPISQSQLWGKWPAFEFDVLCCFLAIDILAGITLISTKYLQLFQLQAHMAFSSCIGREISFDVEHLGLDANPIFQPYFWWYSAALSWFKRY